MGRAMGTEQAHTEQALSLTLLTCQWASQPYVMEGS